MNVPVKAVAFLAAFAALASCSKDKNTNTDQLATLGQATIMGKVMARLVDTAGAASVQYAPTTAVISAWIDTRDYVLGESGSATYAKRYFTATVDASGNYTLTVDVSKYKSATVVMNPASFEYDVVKKVSGKVVKERHVFDPMTTMPVTINANEKKIIDINYN